MYITWGKYRLIKNDLQPSNHYFSCIKCKSIVSFGFLPFNLINLKKVYFLITSLAFILQSICDGYEDCDNGWDESPHLCIGTFLYLN